MSKKLCAEEPEPSSSSAAITESSEGQNTGKNVRGRMQVNVFKDSICILLLVCPAGVLVCNKWVFPGWGLHYYTSV